MKQTRHRREVKLGGSANKPVDKGKESAGKPKPTYLTARSDLRFVSVTAMTTPTLSWHTPSRDGKQSGARGLVEE